MATIAQTLMQDVGSRAAVATTLTGTADTFAYTYGKGMVLIMRNGTAGALSPVIDGAGASDKVPVSGVGYVNATTGYAVGSIAAGATVAIPLDTIFEYLKGAIAITGGTGLVCTLLTY